MIYNLSVEYIEYTDWYENRDRLEQDDVFITNTGDIVKLDHRVPGDGTRWYVANFTGGSFAYDDDEIEPSDLKYKLTL